MTTQEQTDLRSSIVNYIIQNPAKYSPIVFYGKDGSGKTFLLKSIAEEFERLHQKPALYVRAERFLYDYIQSLMRVEEGLFNEKYRNNGLLLIDDIHLLSGKNHTSEKLLNILKLFQIYNKPIILSSNHHPNFIQNMETDLRDSLNGGLILKVEGN